MPPMARGAPLLIPHCSTTLKRGRFQCSSSGAVLKECLCFSVSSPFCSRPPNGVGLGALERGSEPASSWTRGHGDPAKGVMALVQAGHPPPHAGSYSTGEHNEASLNPHQRRAPPPPPPPGPAWPFPTPFPLTACVALGPLSVHRQIRGLPGVMPWDLRICGVGGPHGRGASTRLGNGVPEGVCVA